jgi:hypothetical protein
MRRFLRAVLVSILGLSLFAPPSVYAKDSSSLKAMLKRQKKERKQQEKARKRSEKASRKATREYAKHHKLGIQ